MDPVRVSVSRVGWAAACLAAGALLAGCSATTPAAAPGAAGASATGAPVGSAPSPTTSTSATAAPARAGDCWNATPEALSGWTWDGSATVPCDGSHNAETVYVGQIPDSATAAYGSVPASYEGLVTTACGDGRLSSLFGASVTANPDLWSSRGVPSAVPVEVAVSYYFPTQREWAAGERWFRCDAGAALPGTTPWPTLPASFATTLAQSPGTFGFCLDGQDPGSSEQARSSTPVGRIAACSTTTPWQLVSVVQLRRSPHERFPGAAVAAARAATLCPPAVRPRHIQVPDAFGWNVNTITHAQCWKHHGGRETA